MVAIHQSAGDNALNALMPTLAAHYDDAAALIGRLDHGERFLGKSGLDIATLLVGLFKLGGEPARLHGVLREQ